VQSQGMAHWLKLNISETLGIAANIEFPLPSSFVWKVYNAVKPDLPERSHFEKDSMTWKLMRLLPELKEEPLFAPIAHYMEGDDSGIKTYTLAEKIADTFDQYLVYRPDWLLKWEQGEDQIEDGQVESQPWQPELWRRLVKLSADMDHSLFHRARLTDQLEAIVGAGHKGLKDLIPQQNPRIFVFGIAALPGTYWAVLNAISEYVDVHFFLLNPCRNYWGDIVSEKTKARVLQNNPAAADLFETGNPLLSSWGRLGRDFITLVNQQSHPSFSDSEHFIDYEAENLLQHLQMDILHLQDAGHNAFKPDALIHSQDKTVVAKDDSSIRFVSAHSALREVQVLHDQMLSWFDQDAELKPRDILVMVPDIDVYGPYIEAVFGSADKDQRIPWAISDQGLNKENPIIESFLQLIQLPASRLTLTEVMGLLEIPAIAQRFEIEADSLEQLRHWLIKANVRWGLNEAHRGHLGLPAWEDNSWSKGLKQLMLGLMMPEHSQDFNQLWPVSSVQGNDAELLGRLIHFVDSLEFWYHNLYQQNTDIQGWTEILHQLLLDFYNQQSDSSGDQLILQKIRDQIQRWQDELELSGFAGGLSHDVLVHYLKNTLGKQPGWQRFMAGPVNFCTLMPMRSIPFKVICMLGMNDEDYPRRVPAQSFDLMAQGGYRRGDRSRREDDRYLFLEAVCSAEDKLYISYRGRDSRENNELQPCVLVSELRDYLANGYVLEQHKELPHKQSSAELLKHLVSEQPLQPFNAGYFQPADKSKHTGLHQSYQKLWAQIAADAGEQTAVDSEFVVQPLVDDREVNIRLSPDIEDLKQCLGNPAKFFVQRRLKANLVHYWQDIPQDEVFALDSLQKYGLNQDLLEARIHHKYEQYMARQKGSGLLPVGVWADLALAESNREVDVIDEQLDQLERQGYQLLSPQSHIIELGDYQLSATLDHIYGSQDQTRVVHYRTGRANAKALLNQWVEHLVLCIINDNVQSALLIGRLKEELQGFEIPVIKADKAERILQDLLAFMDKSYCSPQGFFPQIAWDFLFTTKIAPDEDKAAAKQAKVLTDALNSEFSELNDEYIRRCFPDVIAHWGLNQPSDSLQSLWLDLLQPLLDEVKTLDSDAGNGSKEIKGGEK